MAPECLPGSRVDLGLKTKTMTYEIDIAVVIVTYKSAALTIRCLASIQTERDSQKLPIRVIVVDNASGDLPEIERAVADERWSSWVTLLAAPVNGGFAYGNNLGIRHAYQQNRPTFIHLLNPDTVVRPRGIAALVEFLNSNPRVGIAGSSFETADGESWPFAFRFPTLFSEIDRGLQTAFITRLLSAWTVARPMSSAEAQPTDWVSGASMMLRPSMLETIGTLDENFFLYFEETEICHRALMAGFQTWYVPSSRIMHMIGQSTNLTEKSRLRMPLPSYWFESRRRYYSTTRGIRYAALADVIALASGGIGLVKRVLLGRKGTPRFLRDILRHSALLPHNWSLKPTKCYFPPQRSTPLK
jgi:N-acetylglucosaminyl-diphospho-decaprenol L-rhamnosyltransferase